MEEDIGHHTTSTGVVLKLSPPSVWAIKNTEADLEANKPQVPMVFNEAKDREEPNEEDPTYVRKLARHVADTIENLYEVAIATGTKVESVPEGMEGVEGTEWVEVVETLGITVPASKTGRYIAWMKYVAGPSVADWQNLISALLRLAGTPEEEVMEALNSFRGLGDAGADPDGSSGEHLSDESGVRDPVAGAGSDVRGEGGG